MQRLAESGAARMSRLTPLRIAIKGDPRRNSSAMLPLFDINRQRLGLN